MIKNIINRFKILYALNRKKFWAAVIGDTILTSYLIYWFFFL